jgi:circadian clock protein KaiB
MTRPVRFSFRLYLAGDSPNSIQALGNLRALCEELLPSRHEIELVDILEEPSRALADGVMLTPTLVRTSPRPHRTTIGTLSNRPMVIREMEIPEAP